MCSSESFCPRLRCPTQHAGTSPAYSRKQRQLEGRRDSDRRRSILTAFAPAVPFSIGANRFSSSHIGARRGPVEARAKGIVFRWRFDRLSVPTTVASLEKARAFSGSLEPSHPEGILSFWEMYAQRSIEDRLPSLGLEGHIVPGDLGGELAALRVDAIEDGSVFGKVGLTKGDLLLEVDGEPFFDDSTVSELRAWLVRELDARPRKFALRVLRRGAELALDVTVSLEPF